MITSSFKECGAFRNLDNSHSCLKLSVILVVIHVILSIIASPLALCINLLINIQYIINNIFLVQSIHLLV